MGFVDYYVDKGDLCTENHFFGNCSQSMSELYLTLVSDTCLIYLQAERGVCLHGQWQHNNTAR